MENSDKFLGHFTGLRSLELIIDSMKLRFSDFSKTNDPFENKNLLFRIDLRHASGTFVTTSERIIKENLKASYKLLCFTIQNSIKRIMEKPRMWQQYSSMHEGCCIIIKKQIFDSNFLEMKQKSKNYDSQRVSYTLDKWYEKIKGILDGIDKLLKENGYKKDIITDFLWKHKKYFLFSKMKDWREEREYRYCIYDRNKEKGAKFIDIRNSLTEIVLGEQVTDVYTKMLYQKCLEENIKLSKLEWINGYPIKNTVKYTDKSKYPSMDERVQQEIRDGLLERQIK